LTVSRWPIAAQGKWAASPARIINGGYGIWHGCDVRAWIVWSGSKQSTIQQRTPTTTPNPHPHDRTTDRPTDRPTRHQHGRRRHQLVRHHQAARPRVRLQPMPPRKRHGRPPAPAAALAADHHAVGQEGGAVQRPELTRQIHPDGLLHPRRRRRRRRRRCCCCCCLLLLGAGVGVGGRGR
jgi:hypothetical protein